jgi:AraC-like DNA-binding protein
VRHDDFMLPLPYLRFIAEGVRAAGGDVGRWLGLSGLTEADLASASFELDFVRFEELVRNAFAVTREPALGLFVGQRLVASSHGIVGFAAMSSGSIREGLDLIARFSRLRTSMISISLKSVAGGLRVQFEESRPLGAIRRPVLEAIVLSIESEIRPVTSGAYRVSNVAFSFEAPEYEALARELFGCAVTYGASWTGFEIPSEVLDTPLKTADPDALREAALICQRELEKLTAVEPASSRVRRVLLGKQEGFPSLRATARMLHVAPRTLHRRLRDEGTSYRAILEDVRHTLAVEHVRSGRLSMQEVAYILGYSDLANFRRAFKRWEDLPPSAFKSLESQRKGGRG